MADTKRLRGAVIGYGFISGKGHIPAYLERAKTKGDVEIVAIADICEGRRALAKEALPNARIYSDYQTLLENEQLDFIDISTPPNDHAEIAQAALAKGLHVLCEKPLTTSLSQAKELLELARKSKKVLFPCHNYKHAPVVKTIREIIDSGRIGKVHTVTLQTFRNTHAKGVTEWKTHWRREKRYSGGGITMDHGSHSFYLMFDWLSSYPTSVSATMFQLTSANAGYPVDTEDGCSVTLKFPTGVAHAFLTWTAGVRKVLYSIQGDKGAIHVDDDDLQVATMHKTSGPDVAQGAVKWDFEKRSIASHWMDASHVTWFDSLFSQFKSAIEKGIYVSVETEESYRCMEVIMQAYASSESLGQEQPLRGI